MECKQTAFFVQASDASAPYKLIQAVEPKLEVKAEKTKKNIRGSISM